MPLHFSPMHYNDFPLHPKFGMAFSKDTFSELEERAKKNPKDAIAPSSQAVKQLIATMVPKNTLQNSDVSVLPNFTINTTHYDFIDYLNAQQLSLPVNFFISFNNDDGTDDIDTTLCRHGLSQLMNVYSKEKNISTRVYKDLAAFEEDMPTLRKLAQEKPIACLMRLTESVRHYTGCFIQKIDGEIRAYFYDSTGLTLPAWPCGYRGYDQGFMPTIYEAISALSTKGITTAIMPINTTISIQNDSYSCLMSALLFFDGMCCKAYQSLMVPGFTDSYGDLCFHPGQPGELPEHHYYFSESKNHSSSKKNSVRLFTMTYPPLLIGCQSRLALLLMLDPLEKADDLFPEIIKRQTDWQRIIKNNNGKPKRDTVNVFWQVAYVELLKWFQSCYLAQNAPEKQPKYPNFVKLSESGCSEKRELSAFEKRFPPNSLAAALAEETPAITKAPSFFSQKQVEKKGSENPESDLAEQRERNDVEKQDPQNPLNTASALETQVPPKASSFYSQKQKERKNPERAEGQVNCCCCTQ